MLVGHICLSYPTLPTSAKNLSHRIRKVYLAQKWKLANQTTAKQSQGDGDLFRGMVPSASSTVGPAVCPPLSVCALSIFVKVIGKGI